MELDVNLIKELIGCLNRSGLSALRLETPEFKLALERQPAQVAETPPPAAAPNDEPAPEAQPDGTVVKAPIVGTFYESASPDKPSFAKVGQKVKKGDILFIIESMKLMNEIASEFDGTVAEVMAKNGQTVEYGQPIMRIV